MSLLQMPIQRLTIFAVLVFSFSTTLLASKGTHPEQGTPYFTYYTSQMYDGHPQNWAIIQDERGVMYFGNTEGVLEYDGSSWRTISLKNGSAARSLDVDDNGRVYVGGQDDLGYLVPDTTGALQYFSLLETIPEEQRNFGDVRKTYFTSSGVYYITRSQVFRWDGDEMTVITLKNNKVLMRDYGFYWKDKLYLLQRKEGLVSLVNDKIKKIPNGGCFKNKRIYTMLPMKNKGFLIGTATAGFYQYDNEQCASLTTQIDDFLNKNQLYHACTLPNGNYALATSGGIAIIDESGNWLQLLNSSTGFPSERAYHLYVDRQDGLWAALDNGIIRIEISTPLSTYQTDGIIGSVNDVVRHEGLIYLATSQGISFLDAGQVIQDEELQPPRIQNISGFINECLALLSLEDELLTATTGGLFIIKNGNARSLKSSLNYGAFHCFYRSRKNPNIIYVGKQDGVGVIEYKEGSWTYKRNILGIKEAIYTMSAGKDGTLWLGTKYQGIISIQNPLKQPIITKFNQVEHQLPSMNNNKVFYSKKEVIIATEKGLYRFNKQNKVFEPIKQFSGGFDNNNYHVTCLVEDKQQNIWIHAKEGRGVAMQQGNDLYTWQLTSMNRLSKSELNSMYIESTGIIWLGGLDGLIRYDTNLEKKKKANFSTLIRNIEVGNEELSIFRGAYCDDNQCTSLQQSDAERPILDYKNNTLKFSYAALSYDYEVANQYKYILEGFNIGWSEWSYDNKKEYTNLSPNFYRFKVKSRNAYGQEGEEGIYEFVIENPWYQTWPAYIMYGLLFVGVIFGITRFRTRRLLSESRKLQDKVDERTSELKKSLEATTAMQKQLVVQEKLASLGQLTAGIAHEIQNPLNFINNFAELSTEVVVELKEDIDSQAESLEVEVLENVNDALYELKENVEKINKHGKRINSIVKNMLRHSRAKGNEKIMTDINKVIREYLKLAYHGFRANDSTFNAKLDVELDNDIAPMMLVSQDIGRAILNIVNNAFYAIHAKQKEQKNKDYHPTIRITSKNLDEKIKIRIRDNGNGIPESIKKQIFDPFFTTKPTGAGTGLGLSLTYDIIVHTHRGNLNVHTKKGVFTEFIISIPKEVVEVSTTTK